MRAVVVFARFPDGGEFDACDPEGWPDPDEIPAWAGDILENPTLPLSPTWQPTNPRSLTSLYWHMSGDGGGSSTERHVLIGEVYPSVVECGFSIETLFNQHYGPPPADLLPAGYANRNILEQVAADETFALSEFDVDVDGGQGGVLDYVFIFYRSMINQDRDAWINGQDRWGGYSSLLLGPFGGSLTLDGIQITGESGILAGPRARAIGPDLFHIRDWGHVIDVFAHEYGHDVLPSGFSHWPNLGPYGMMDGSYSSGPHLVSAIERMKMGWVAPQVIESTGPYPDEVTLVLEDCVTKGNAGLARVNTHDPRQYFLLEVRDSTATPFTQPDPVPAPDCPGCPPAMTACQSPGTPSGLLVWHIYEPTPGSMTNFITGYGWSDPPDCYGTVPNVPGIDLESALGMFADPTGAPDPVAGFDKLSADSDSVGVADDGDAFKRGVNNVFGPYTNPGTGLYAIPASCTGSQDAANARTQSVYSGITIYDMKWEPLPGGGNGKMTVKIRFDGPTPPPAPLALPDGMVWDGNIGLMADVEVTAGNELTVAAGSRVVSAAAQDLLQVGADPGSSEILVNGDLVSNGTPTKPVLFTSSRDDAITNRVTSGETTAAAPGNWYGIRKGASATLTATDSQLKYASGAVNFAVSVFPDFAHELPSGFTFTDNLNDVTFDRDVTIPAGITRTVPSGCKVGFAPADALNAASGVDPTRVELIVEPTGQLVLAGTPNEVILQSTRASPTSEDWLGVRLPGTGALSATNARIRHAASALVWESATWPNFANIAEEITFENVLNHLGFERDHVVPTGQTITIPAGWSIGFSANHDEVNLGVDTGRCEVICDGNFVLAGTSTQPVILRSTKSGDLGSWYGVRLTDYAKILTTTQFGVIQEAGGALSVEGLAAAAGFPNFTQFAGKLTFTGNRSDICFDLDVTIPNNLTVTVPAGWRIGFRSGDAAVNDADSVSPLCELILNGKLLAGTLGGARVAFTSNAKSAEITNVGWYGLRFRETPTTALTVPDGVEVPMSVSKIETGDVAGAKHAICIETLAAPQLMDVNFIGTGDHATPIHILLKDRDVVVPYGRKWYLNPNTQVVAENASTADYDFGGYQLGVTSKVDLIVQGEMRTFGNLTIGRVKLGPRTLNNSTGHDWGGLYFDWTSQGSVVDFARVSHASIPISAYYADMLVIKNTEIRHFANMAIWVHHGVGDTLSVVLEGNDIRRGVGLGGTLGQSGIKLEFCEAATIRNNRIDLKDTISQFASGGAAIHLFNSKPWCLNLGTPVAGDFVIEGNLIAGLASAPQGKFTGIKMEWACGPGARLTKILDHRGMTTGIKDWSKYGMEFFQCSDVQVSCNDVTNNDAAVSFSRNSSVTFTETVRFSQNAFTGPTSPNKPVVQSDNVLTSVFGPTVAGLTGGNRFDISSASGEPNRHYYFGASQGEAALLNLRNQHWKRAGTVRTDPGEIASHLLLTPSVTSDVTSPLPVAASCQSGGAALPPMTVEAVDGEGSTDIGPVRTISHQALRTELISAWPSPSRTGTRIRFSLSAGQIGAVGIAVFDVSGRRVRNLFNREMSTGIYETTWDGADEGGRRTAPGIYFVRLTTGDRSDVRKIVRIE